MTPHRTLLSLLLILPLVACGGGGGGDPVTPTAEVTFPTARSSTDSTSITVSGRATPGETGIASIRIDGVEAQTDDGFATWTATVPLTPGVNRIAVEVEDLAGAVFERVDEVRVRRGAIFESLSGIDYDPVRNLVWVVDESAGKLYAVDPVQGGGSLLTGGNVGRGPNLQQPFTVAAEPGGTRIFVADWFRRELLEVDLLTGDRAVLETNGDPVTVALDGGGIEFDASTGTLLFATVEGLIRIDPATGAAELVAAALGGPAGTPKDVAIDTNTGTIYLLYAEAVFSVSPTSGTHSVASNQGDEFFFGSALDVDPKTGLLYVASGERLFAIDPVSGTQELIAALQAGEVASGLAFDDASGRMLVVESGRDFVFSLDPFSNVAGTLLADAVGDGPRLARPLDFEQQGDRAFGLDSSFALFEIDPDSGDRTLLSGRGSGNGDDFDFTQAFAIDPAANRAFVADRDVGVLEVDLDSGDRSPFALVGSEDGFASANSVARHPDGRLFVLDGDSQGIFELDPATGEQRPISVQGDGKGDDLNNPANMTLDAAGGRLFVTDFIGFFISAVVSVDLETGVRTVVASETVGSGAELSLASGLAYDEARDLLYVGDSSRFKVLAIDLATLNRIEIAAAGTGRGPLPDSFTLVELDESGDRLFCGSRRFSALIAISLTTLDRVLASK